jgi:hypothetical protein
MTVTIGRRELLAALGGAAAAWPASPHAQLPRRHVARRCRRACAQFRQGKEIGYVEGENIVIESREKT